MSDLTDLAADLTYAAGTGAAKLATSVVARGNVEASTGFHGPELPGPALQTVLARHSGHAGRRAGGVDEAAVPAVADHMAGDAANQAAQLLGGGGR